MTTTAPTSSTSSSLAPGGPRITVTPRSDLAASAVVEVTGSGFSPNRALVVNECAAKGSATGPGDCNLAGLAAVTSDASGEVRLSFRVVKGPFGANRITCGPAQRCLVSVSEASPTPSEEADVEITFA
ncbi:MAG: neocarzinostatin apoprotein domain-containing protein [Actinomycetota bacterium]|nr:neocarzinostatin apoprotein domain-containing protein [Actinomycetota bacterium]